MPSIIDIIDDYTPANNEIDTPLSSTITILFDRVMDETALSDQVFIEGPDTDQYVGPGFELLGYPNTVSHGDDFLASPGMQGIVQGDFSYQKVSTTDPDVLVSGSIYRTKLIFTPEHSLAPLTLYTVNVPDFVDSGSISYTGYITFSFTTGTGSITELPTEVSTSIISTALADTLSDYFTGSSSGDFKVVKTIPKDHAVQVVASGLNSITIEFNNPVDVSSVTDENIVITTVVATGHPTAAAEALGNITKTLTVAGNKIFADIGTTQILANNIVEVILASGIRGTTGSHLEEEFSFEFLTTTYPSYSDVLKVRLEGAGYIGDLDDEVIQLAILEASLEADAIVFNTELNLTGFFVHARREWVTCKALLMLLVNLGNGVLKSKTLDNLTVSYDTTGLQSAMDRAFQCLMKWEGQVITGGQLKSSGQPKGVIKGHCDPDRPVIGRLWVPTDAAYPSTGAANSKVRPYRRAYTIFNPNKKFW